MEFFLVAVAAFLILFVAVTCFYLGMTSATFTSPSQARARAGKRRRESTDLDVGGGPLNFGLGVSGGDMADVSHDPHTSQASYSHDSVIGAIYDEVVTNPATGLTMIGGAGGIDTGGNLFGSNGMSSVLDDISNFDRGFDAGLDNFSSFDSSGFDHELLDGSTGFGNEW